jgi:hypothetical protein
MYTIYHIIGVKIGCTDRIASIRVKEQGHSNFEILETHSNIEVASKREQELQFEYGYEVDDVPYIKTRLGALGNESRNKAKSSIINKFGNSAGQMHTKESRKKSEENHKKKINQFSLDHTFIKKWDSVKQIKETLNLQISSALKGRQKTAGGYIWKYDLS